MKVVVLLFFWSVDDLTDYLQHQIQILTLPHMWTAGTFSSLSLKETRRGQTDERKAVKRRRSNCPSQKPTGSINPPDLIALARDSLALAMNGWLYKDAAMWVIKRKIRVKRSRLGETNCSHISHTAGNWGENFLRSYFLKSFQRLWGESTRNFLPRCNRETDGRLAVGRTQGRTRLGRGGVRRGGTERLVCLWLSRCFCATVWLWGCQTVIKCNWAWTHLLMTLIAAAPAALLTLPSLSPPHEHDKQYIFIEELKMLVPFWKERLMFVKYNICLYLYLYREIIIQM